MNIEYTVLGNRIRNHELLGDWRYSDPLTQEHLNTCTLNTRTLKHKDAETLGHCHHGTGILRHYEIWTLYNWNNETLGHEDT